MEYDQQAQKTQISTAAPTHQPRPFATAPEISDLSTPKIQAKALGHSLAKMVLAPSASSPDPKPPKLMKVQPKLMIGAVGDRYEQEADQVAAQVVQRLNAPKLEPSPAIQRLPEEEEELQMKPILQREVVPEEEEELQMKPTQEAIGGGDASADLESAINSARGSGQSMNPDLQAKMGAAIGADFSGVKIHTDAQSDQMNRSIQAKAFTTGKDIFFGQGEYNPGSTGGQELLAHELTHVVQQNGVGVQSVQRLPTADAFKQNTPGGRSIFKKSPIAKIDDLIKRYHLTQIEKYDLKVQALTSIVTACDAHKTSSDKDPVRQAGVLALELQAKKELEIFTCLSLGMAATSSIGVKVRELAEAQDEVSEAEALGFSVAEIHEHIKTKLDHVANQELNGSQVQQLIQNDLDQLEALSQDASVPAGTRLIIEEVLSNADNTNFSGGLPGARLKNQMDTHNKKYQVNHALSPSEGLGSAERLGSLTHELTHVSSGESFDNTKSFMLFSPDMAVGDVIALAQDRVVKVNQLVALAQNQQFSPKQRSLLEGKLAYAGESKLGLYAARFSDAAIQKLNKNPNDPEGLSYQGAAQTMRAVSTAVPTGNSVLIEYDTVMNQMLVYMHMWKIPVNNPFYVKLQQVADEAYQQRLAARNDSLLQGVQNLFK
jgi:Domain of unknown function (DUF4157)